MNSIYSLLCVLYYNGHDDDIKKIYNYILNYQLEASWNNISYPDNLLSEDPDAPDRILWSVLVYEFGDYGTSPRFGWIEDKEAALAAFKEYLDEEKEEE